MIATDGFKVDEKNLYRSSDSDDRSFLFRMSNDLMMLVQSYLEIESICHIDVAVSNAAERKIWITMLSMNYLATFSEYQYCKESIRWLVKRGIRLEILKIKDKGSEVDRVDGTTFLGLNISSLRCISFDECNSIRDEEVLLIAHRCPHLAEICLSGCDGVTDASLIALGRCCHKLISIDVGRCKNITDKGLEGFANCCQNVTAEDCPDCLHTSNMEQGSLLLSMNNSDECESALVHSCCLLSNTDVSLREEIADRGISSLAHRYPILRNISLSNCKRITDVGISALAHSCPQLSNINFSYCPRISDIGISAVAHSCPFLININFSYCWEITDIGISALAHGCPNLSNINFSFCLHVTDMGILDVVTNCRLLCSISVYHCLNITVGFLSDLQRDYPHLRISG